MIYLSIYLLRFLKNFISYIWLFWDPCENFSNSSESIPRCIFSSPRRPKHPLNTSKTWFLSIMIFTVFENRIIRDKPRPGAPIRCARPRRRKNVDLFCAVPLLGCGSRARPGSPQAPGALFRRPRGECGTDTPSGICCFPWADPWSGVRSSGGAQINGSQMNGTQVRLEDYHVLRCALRVFLSIPRDAGKNTIL